MPIPFRAKDLLQIYVPFVPSTEARSALRHRPSGCVQAGDDGVRFLLVSGRPLGEPVAWYGPIVMNTQDELRRAFEELEAGTFLKPDAQE